VHTAAAVLQISKLVLPIVEYWHLKVIDNLFGNLDVSGEKVRYSDLKMGN
jgi:hypothetical protein